MLAGNLAFPLLPHVYIQPGLKFIPGWIHCTNNEVFHYGFLQYLWPNPQFAADLVTFTKEILNGKLHFCALYGQSSFSGYMLKLLEISAVPLFQPVRDETSSFPDNINLFNVNNVNTRTSIPVFLLLTLNKKMLAEFNFIASSLEWWYIKQHCF